MSWDHNKINCPNCGKADFDSKRKGFECPQCGYKIIEAAQLGEVTLVFCDACGCHYSNGCPTHDKSTQRQIKK